jgi:hypothetical protein
MALNKKPTLYDDPATTWLMEQSKAALADMLTEVLRLDQESADDPASREAAEKRFGTIVARRHDLKTTGDAIFGRKT